MRKFLPLPRIVSDSAWAVASASTWWTRPCDPPATGSAADFGELSPRADYVWGTAVLLGQLQPGDVVQFSNYRMRVHVATRSTDGSSSFADEESERPHHTAIVESVGPNGEVTVLEQNVGGRLRVLRNTLRFSASTSTETRFEGSETITTTRTVTVSGQVWFYRPQTR